MTGPDDSNGRTGFILANTSVRSPPHVPEIRLHLADEAHDLWHRTEEELQQIGLPPPFWAFAWAGGQGLARHLLDNPGVLDNQGIESGRILDLATGSGLVAIAAALALRRQAGSAQPAPDRVIAADTDPFCASAVSLNARLNGVETAFCCTDLLAMADPAAYLRGEHISTLLAGDVFYDREMALRVEPFLRKAAGNGITVLIGDPGRAYLPKTGLEKLATYRVPVTRALEDSEIKQTVVWRVGPA